MPLGTHRYYFFTMKTLKLLPIISSILLVACSCSKDSNHDLNSSKDDELSLEIENVKKETRATKVINPFDELGCEVYRTSITNPDPSEPTKATIDYTLADTQKEGTGSYVLQYSFTGKSLTAGPEKVYFEQTWGDYRSDLSFYPLGLSLWVKGNKNNKGIFRFLLMEDDQQFSEDLPHDVTRKRWKYFAFEDKEILSKEGWNRLIMPYTAFKEYKKGVGISSSSSKPKLNRSVGYRIELVNTKHELCSAGEVCIDHLEQLTSYELKAGKPKFSSIFIQLNKPAYDHTDWDQEFEDSRAVGINTWIIQYSEQFTGSVDQTNVSFYQHTNLPWVTQKCDYIDQMFAAAERHGMKIILGLYPGDYSKTNTADPAPYNKNLERNKKLFDEVYALFGNHPALAGWYITEEFHDGSFPVGWQQEPALSMLANYLENVAVYIKSKSDKPVAIAPALWRGMPADLCGRWFDRILSQTPHIDFLYLQDIGGRCLVDFDVDLPNWYAEIKKACDKNGIKFGVDVESFKSCNCPNVPYHAKNWSELSEQLYVAGLFTEYITNFSWVTFKKGTDNYSGYKKYLEENGLL